MPPDLWQKLCKAWQRYRDLPEAQRAGFLEQLRIEDPQTADELATLRQRHHASGQAQSDAPPSDELAQATHSEAVPVSASPETADYHSEASSRSVQERTKPNQGDSDTGNPDSDVPVQIGRYRIDAKLGEGGMGVVYRGHDPDLHRFLAVKVLKEGRRNDIDLARRFLEEAQIMGRLQHPGIAPIHEIGSFDDGRPFFSMKQIQGKTLAQLLKERGDRRLACHSERTGEPPVVTDLPRFISIFEQICQTLAYAHSQGIIHRDLKPANIMVGAFGEVQVMDWGLAKLVRGPSSVVSSLNSSVSAAKENPVFAPDDSVPSEEPRTTDHGLRTRAGVVIGTPAYMAPEQARGEIDALDERCDVFGLGAILCEILTGRPPFFSTKRDVHFQLARRGDVTDAFARLERCGADAELRELAKKCLAAQKENRPLDAGAVTQAVSAYQDQVQERMRRAELDRAQTEVKVVEERKRGRLRVMIAGLLLLLVIGGSAAALWYQNHLAKEARRVAEAANRRAAALKEIGLALTEAKKSHDELQEKLRETGGVFKLLNRPAEWKIRIDIARAALERAGALAKSGKVELDDKTSGTMSQLERLLDRDDADFALAQEFDRIRLDRARVVRAPILFASDENQYFQKTPATSRKFAHTEAEKNYLEIFRRAGLAFEPGQEKALAAGIQKSSIKEQLIAALDDFALVTFITIREERRSGLDAEFKKKLMIRNSVLYAVSLAMDDDDLWNKKFRAPVLNLQALQELAVNAPIDNLSPQLLHVVGSLLMLFDRTQLPIAAASSIGLLGTPIDQRSSLACVAVNLVRADAEWFYRRAQVYHPADFWINLSLGNELAFTNPREAASFYRAALAIRPNSMVHMNLGNVLADAGDRTGALAVFRKGLTIEPQNEELHFNIGVTLIEQDKLADAMVAFRESLKCNPNFAPAHFNLGNALLDQKDFAGAIVAFQRVTKLRKKDGDAWYNLGIALDGAQKRPEAISAFRKAIDLDANDDKAWNRLGNLLEEQGTFSEAVAAFRNAIRIKPDHAHAYNNLGIAYSKKNMLPEAMEAYQKAIAYKNDLASAHLNLGVTYAKQKRYPEAYRSFTTAMKHKPGYADAYFNFGITLAKQQKFSDAEKKFEKAIEVNSKYVEAYINLGSVLAKQKKYVEAITALRDALALAPNHTGAQNLLANALEKNGDPNAVIAEYRQGVKRDPKNVTAHIILGVALRKQKNLSEAAEILKKAIALDSKKAKAHYELAKVYQAKEEWKYAVAAYRRAIALNAKYVEAYNNMGTILCDKLRRYEEAATAFRKAIDLKPKDSAAHYNLGNALGRQRKYREAIVYYKKAIILKPKYASAYVNLGLALRTQNDLPGAIAAYRKAIEIDAESVNAHFNLGSALRAQGDLPGAIAAYEKAGELDANYADPCYALGNIYLNQKKWSKAVAHFKKAIARDPAYAEAHCNLGHALREEGDFAAAVKALRRGHQLGSQRKNWRYSSAQWVKRCEALLELDQKLTAVLKGERKCSAAELLNLAAVCSRYKKSYGDSLELYTKAFAADPDLEKSPTRGYRYSAARAAVLFAAGKGKGANNSPADERAKKRRQALSWLEAELAAAMKLFDSNPLYSMVVHSRLKTWQDSADLISVREAKSLSLLPNEEREAWQKLWSDVDKLRKTARASYSETELKGTLSSQKKEQSHSIKLAAGKTYMIDMQSKQFDTFLRLHDTTGKKIAENDDIDYKGRILDSRLIFAPKQDGVFRIIAASFQNRGRGTYNIIVREFAKKAK